MKSTAANQSKKLKGFICSMVRLQHFNEEYEDTLEDELAEIDAFLASVSDNPDSIYNYVSTTRKGAVHKWC